METNPTSIGSLNPTRRWWGLLVLALPALIVSMDQNVLYLALPELSRQLNPTLVEQLWMMDVYGLMVAVFLIPIGAMSDRWGHQRVLHLGAIAFVACSVLAAFAPTSELLIAARALLGVAGATLAPSALALITALFPDAGERAKAVGLWMTCFMVGMAAGPIVGGLLLKWFWWGSVFLLGIPVMLALLFLGPALLPKGTAHSAVRTDLCGAALSAAAVLAIVYGIKSVTTGSISSVAAVAVLMAGLVCAAAFIVRLRGHPEPLVPIALFTNRRFTAALCIMTLSAVAIGGSYFYFAQYLQIVADLSALHAGLVLVAPAVAFAVGAILGPLLAARLPMHAVLAGGLAMAAVGLGIAAFVRNGEDLQLAVLGLTLSFLGFGPGAALGTDLIVGSARADQAGSASALSETGTELGSALGVALLGSLGALLYRHRLDATVPDDITGPTLDSAREGVIAAETAAPELALAAETAYTVAFGWIAVVSAGIVAVMAIVTILTLPPPRPAPTDGETARVPHPKPSASDSLPKDRP